MPGARAAKSSDITESERLKFGAGKQSASGAAKMPGARAAKSTDMTESERLKFGASTASSSGGAKIPGAHWETGISPGER